MSANVIPLYPMDSPVVLSAPAKVNLFLDVLDRRTDGYHNLDAVNVSVDLFDQIQIELNESGHIEIECNWPDIPTGEDNHLHRAAARMLAGTSLGIRICLNKQIPVGAGLGGGTSDGAALIRFLGRAMNMDEHTQLSVGLEVGSDVPYSILGGPARVRGRGERVDRIDSVSSLRLVLLDPGVSHKTQTVYALMPPYMERGHPPAELFIQTWKRGNLSLLGMQMFNAFQDVVFSRDPHLLKMRDLLLDMGCLGACLTGTGSHLVGLLPMEGPGIESWNLPDETIRLTEVRTLQSDFPGWFRRGNL